MKHAICKWVNRNPGVSCDDVADVFGISSQLAVDIVSGLRDEGQLKTRTSQVRKIIGTTCWFVIFLPFVAVLGIPVMIGEGAQWIVNEWMVPLLDRIERWIDN